MRRRAAPSIDRRAALVGFLVAAAVTIALPLLGFSALGPIAGSAAGGAVAGRVAGRDEAFHGATIAALLIVALAIVASFGAASAGDVLADTAWTVLSDLLLLLVGAAGGWLARRS